MKMSLSIFDDEDKRMTEIDERTKDSRRLGYFFKPWFWDIGTNRDTIKFFDNISTDKLKEVAEKVEWIKYNNFIDTKRINIDERNWKAHYLAHIILDQYIVNDTMYDYISQRRKLKHFEFSYQLKETATRLNDILKTCCDDSVQNEIETQLYITQSDRDGRFVLNFQLVGPGIGKLRLKFDELNSK